MQLTLKQRIFIVNSFETHKSEVITFRSFQRKFGIVTAKLTVRRVFNKWKENETVQNLNRRKTGRSEEIIVYRIENWFQLSKLAKLLVNAFVEVWWPALGCRTY